VDIFKSRSVALTARWLKSPAKALSPTRIEQHEALTDLPHASDVRDNGYPEFAAE
jgi:hypothetical protein